MATFQFDKQQRISNTQSSLDDQNSEHTFGLPPLTMSNYGNEEVMLFVVAAAKEIDWNS